MIIDSFLGLERYFSMHPKFEKAFQFLRQQPLESLAEGRYEIEGDEVYAMITDKPGKNVEDAKLEVHDSYIDIQILLRGQESMGYLDRRFCKEVHTPYDAAKDIASYKDAPEVFFTLEPGNMVIFFPYDAHAPMIGTSSIRKIVIKIRVN
ncbi:MAG: YhcH/YjgK/YiaL family protein [Prevotellaceae bacterium]|jgi:YhcH/YjgK/YiaL family protein|nr:YhcH/YjgK/YiaL family protein [Prevotellaceae bacterium]